MRPLSLSSLFVNSLYATYIGLDIRLMCDVSQQQQNGQQYLLTHVLVVQRSVVIVLTMSVVGKNCISFRFRFQNPHQTSSAMHLRVYVRPLNVNDCNGDKKKKMGIFVDKVYSCVPIALSDCARRKIENKFHSLQYAGSICLAHMGVTTLCERRSSSNVVCRWPCTPTENSKQKREETNRDMNPTKDKNCSPRSRTKRFTYARIFTVRTTTTGRLHRINTYSVL